MIYKGHFILDDFKIICPYSYNAHYYLGQFESLADAKKVIDDWTYGLSELGGLYEEVCEEILEPVPVYYPGIQLLGSINLNDNKNTELMEREKLRVAVPSKKDQMSEQQRCEKVVADHFLKLKRAKAREYYHHRKRRKFIFKEENQTT